MGATTTTAGTAVAQTTAGTVVAQTTAGTVSTTASSAGTASQLGLCLTTPTTSTLGTGIKAAFLVTAPILVAGAAVAGIALLSYAVTKAAIEPN